LRITLMISFDQRSPHRLVVAFALSAARVYLAHAVHRVRLAAEVDVPLHMPRPVEFRREQADAAADRLAPADHAGQPLFVDRVLHRNEVAVRRDIGPDQVRRPFGVVGLHRDHRDVERPLLRQLRHVADMQRLHRHHHRFGRRHAVDREAVAADLLDMLRPAVDQRHVMAGAGEQGAGIAADGAGADEHDAGS
jgi:hypothetical protein